MRVTGWKCAVCAATVDIAQSFPWRCPNSTPADRHHVLQIVTGDDVAADSYGVGASQDAQAGSFTRYDEDLAWAAYAAANGMDRETRLALVAGLDVAVRAVAGVGFVPTPFARSNTLSDALGFAADGGVWVKDETGGVAGSQKARHLFSILLHLRAAETRGQLPERPPLAIASCGNAALAAATLALAASWPIDVYVPTWMSDAFGARLDWLGARIHRCERKATDPPGDPAMFRFREAVDAGAIPFTVQGPENALALDGGRTIGWEICDQLEAAGAPSLDRVFIQVGGGAFASCVGSAIASRCPTVRLHAVQTEGCAPLARAWNRAADLRLERGQVAQHWEQLMTVWDDPHSVADGILDDETYDWIGVFEAMADSGGSPVVASEETVIAAHQLARASGFDVSATGSAGLAGLMTMLADSAEADSPGQQVSPSERVAVVMSGVER